METDCIQTESCAFKICWWQHFWFLFLLTVSVQHFPCTLWAIGVIRIQNKENFDVVPSVQMISPGKSKPFGGIHIFQ